MDGCAPVDVTGDAADVDCTIGDTVARGDVCTVGRWEVSTFEWGVDDTLATGKLLTGMFCAIAALPADTFLPVDGCTTDAIAGGNVGNDTPSAPSVVRSLLLRNADSRSEAALHTLVRIDDVAVCTTG